MPKTHAIPVCALDGRCMRFKHFYPLLAFLIPTALIGYGVVIPRSAIAGVNELTIGFGSALLGATIAYWQGIRVALRKEMKQPEKSGWGGLSPTGPFQIGINLPAGSLTTAKPTLVH